MERPSAEELLKRIQMLESCHARIKQLILSRNHLTQAHYFNIIQSMGQAVHVFDHQYRIRFWNPVAQDIYGLTAAQVFGKTPTEILVDPKDAVMADYFLERTVKGETWSGEFPVTNNKGETFDIICTNTPFRDHNGTLIGGICIFSDSRPYRRPSNHLAVSKVKLKLLTPDDASPWGQYPFGVFTGNTSACAQENYILSKLCRFGWKRLYVNQEHEQMRLTSWGIQPHKSLEHEIIWEDLTTKRVVGQGSCGTVYHGLWHGSDVAIKLFTYQEYSDNAMALFKQEVSLMKRLRHPNILLFMGAVTSPQHLCIVTEFLPRGSLFRILQQNSTQLDWSRRLQMAIDIAQGMNYLHQYNPPIVHRDLKSSNLLVDKNWRVKVGDFGLSRIKHQTYLNTKSGKGTPQWMAPEIICNEQADEKCDVYSYGVVLWEIVTQKIPWDDLNPMQVIAAVGFMNRRLEIPKDVDPLWTSLIESCWCSDPQSRPTFQEILYKLEDLQSKYAAESKK